MSVTIEATKFIIADEVAIWGYGDSEDAAWADLRRGMTLAKIPHQDDVDTEDAYCPNYWHEDQFKAFPATAALVADVEQRGGRIEFAMVKGIACTGDEEEAFDDAQGAAP